MKPTLLILAAGIGSRYGGLKQLDAVGPSGEAIIDYSIYDAIRAGFGRIVFVIRKDIEKDFREVFEPKLRGKIEVGYVFQELDMVPGGIAVPAERKKPWGTAHAVWVAAGFVKEPFVAINADDFYGHGSYISMVDYLMDNNTEGSTKYCMIGFQIEHTLSEHGSVSRGLCEATGDGFLTAVVERTEIEKKNNIIYYKDDSGKNVPMSGHELVSMNIWGFTPAIFNQIEKHFKAFFLANAGNIKSELYIPTVVNDIMKKGEGSVKVLPAADRWFGVTYREDKPQAVQNIRSLISKGIYPEKLWE